MLILALSTSGAVPSAALASCGDDGEVRLLGMEHRESALTHSETIMPLAQKVLEGAGVTLSQIDAFACDVGPGSFTGVRIGVSAVNAMAFAMGKPIIPVDSLYALAIAHMRDGIVCPVIDARSERIYTAAYRRGETVLAPAGLTVDELAAALTAVLTEHTESTPVLFLGDGARAYAGKLASAVPDAIFADENSDRLLADAVAFAAAKLYNNGEGAVVEAAPLYLRPTQAERMYKERGV